MLFLKKLEDNEESYKLLYHFSINNRHDWKEATVISFIMQGVIPPKQNGLSDYEYFKLLRKLQKQIETLPTEEYILHKNYEPITNLYIIMRSSKTADISFVTRKQYQKQGYATQALKMVETILFQNPNILYTSITDLSQNNVSTKIALKNGYTYSEELNIFLKQNPNIKLNKINIKTQK